MQQPSPHLASFFGPWVPPPHFTPAPPDKDTKDRITLLAKYAMQNGAAFIDVVRTKQAGNVQYSFLTPGGHNHDFWLWALYATGTGLPLEQPPAAGAPAGAEAGSGAAAGAAAGGGMPPASAPPAPAAAPALPPDVASGFAQVLDALTGSKESIKTSQAWFLACAPYAAGMAHLMASRAMSLTDFTKQLHLVYLANDILFKALQKHQATLQQQQQQQADAGVTDGSQPAAAAAAVSTPPGTEPVAQAFAPVLGVLLAATQARANALLAAEGASEADKASVTGGLAKLPKMLGMWSDRGVFDAATVARLTQEMQAADPAAALAANQPAPQVVPPAPAAAAGAPDHAMAAAPAASAAPPAAAAAAVPGGYPGWPNPAAAAAAAAVQQPYPGAYPPAYPGAPAGYAQPPYPGAPAAAAGAPGAAPYPGAAYPGWPQPAPGAPQAWPGGPGYPPQPTAAAPPAAAAAAAVPPGWPAAPPGWPGHPPAAPGYPPSAPGAYPGAAPGYPGGVPPGVAHVPVPAPAVAQRPPSPEVEPVSSFCFPPGLIPQLVRDKQRWADAYAPIELRDIEEAGLPPPPHKDAYLKSRIDKFLTEVHDWRPGSTRADLEEERAAQRRAAGIDANSDDEFSGLGAAALTAGQRGRRRRPRSPREGDGLGMHSDGSFRGGRGNQHAGLGSMGGGGGLGANGTADPSDMYSSYRQKRSGAYHSMILKGITAANAPPPR